MRNNLLPMSQEKKCNRQIQRMHFSKERCTKTELVVFVERSGECELESMCEYSANILFIHSLFEVFIEKILIT